MLITFHSKAAPEVLMRSEDALPLLKAAGKQISGTIPERGVFTPDQLKVAIAGLEAAVRADGGSHTAEDEENPDKEPVHPVDRPVGLSQRAFPLIDMMKQSLEGNADLTWELSRGW
ncbi:hypothetical protein CEG14_00560 [Bordetella genomosp. 1]|uniref:DUF1840 domain-containing protein n=1 Tax=Bordetella genomosp. 1 TaxID=1395607 RepID=A0A261ST06_9BORD|nr:DUF1840 domain-containing protein [Bordetella genomosp. 1]MDQ8030865.1 DUF1840 domain-containing protein [Bordetella sp.]OZI40295.1 hypothetical protein CEG14_00560 [Bordetella genomosp. 1]OZI68489.1 hypothetical protein CAL27_03225 [Bordetella genomosp. 1]